MEIKNKTKIPKKGQITVFIIVGIVILTVVGVSVYIATEGFSFGDIPGIQVSSQVQPIYDYVTSCMENTIIQGLKIISVNGGYINPLEGRKLDYRSHLSDIIIRGPNRLPYWYHFDVSSSTFRSHAPPLTKTNGIGSIEEQLENYLKSNIEFCFNGFVSFSERYDISYDYISPIVSIVDSGLSVYSEIPMRVNFPNNPGESAQSLRDFYIEIPTEFKRIYNLASDISRTQSLTGFLERPILELLSYQSGIGRPLPPFYEVEIFKPGSGDFWLREDVHSHIKRNILPKISSVKILFTQNVNYPLTAGPIQTTFQEIALQDIIDPRDDYYMLSASFSYPPSSNPFIKVGSGGAMLRPDEASSDVGGIFSQMLGAVIRRYRFNYDISFPVVTRICDTTSFRGQGLCFYFSLEGNIKMNDAFLPHSIDYSGIFGSTSGESDFVNPNDPGQYVDKFVEFEVIDKQTKEPIDNVQVFYSCGAEFYIDNIVLSNDVSRFFGKMPFCAAGGRIILRSPGYHSTFRRWNNQFDSSHVILENFEMNRIRHIPVSILKREPGSFMFSENELDDNDKVILHISRIRTDQAEDEFPFIQTYVFGNLSSGSGSDFSETMLDLVADAINFMEQDIYSYTIQELLEGQIEMSTIELSEFEIPDFIGLVPGDYQVSLTYIVSGEPAVHIPQERKRICLNGEVDDNGFCLIKLDEYELPQLNMPSWVVSEINFIWTLTDELYDKDILIFRVPDVRVPRNYDELMSHGSVNININRFMPLLVDEDEY